VSINLRPSLAQIKQAMEASEYLHSARKGIMVCTLTLHSSSWLATLTGEATLTVYSTGNLLALTKTVLAVNDAASFNGFLFKINGSLVLFAHEESDRGEVAIGPN
jgi:hypothetical protein